jgi:hypothetical protein
MQNLSTLEMGLILVAAVLFVPMLIWWARRAESSRREREAAALAELEEKAAEVRQQQLRKGTHDQYGHRLCVTCNDKMTRATQPAFVVQQSEGVWDLVRRWFGAPARYIVKQLKKGDENTDVYCDQCADLVRLAHEDFILRYENRVREFKRDAAVELRRWLIHGCNDSVILLIEKHDELIKQTEPQPRRAAVVPLKTEANGG